MGNNTVELLRIGTGTGVEIGQAINAEDIAEIGMLLARGTTPLMAWLIEKPWTMQASTQPRVDPA
jgi:hypothetical protein